MSWLGGLLAALVVALLVLAALADIATRTIPDTIAIACGGIWAVLNGQGI